MPSTSKGRLVEPTVGGWPDIPALEAGNAGSPYPRTPVRGASRAADGAITDVGDSNEQFTALMTRELLVKNLGQSVTVDPAPVPTSNGPMTVLALVNSLVNRIKAITGNANWWDAPAGTLYGLSAAVASKADAATIAAAIAGKANLAGDTFTGAINGPTPAAGDKSAKLATTAWMVTPTPAPSLAGINIAFVSGGALSGGTSAALQGATANMISVWLTQAYTSNSSVPCSYSIQGIPTGWALFYFSVGSNSTTDGTVEPACVTGGNSVTVWTLGTGTHMLRIQMVLVRT